MDHVKLPNVEIEEPEQPAPQIEIVNDNPEEPKIFKEKTTEAPIESPVEEEPAAPVKPKRKMSQKQLDHLAKMRANRAAKRAAAPPKPAPAPKKAAPQQLPAPAPPPQQAPVQSADAFLSFMNHMETYKNLKDNWKKREIEKAKAHMAKKEPETKVEKTVETKQQKKPVSKPPSLLSNHASSNNTYSDYF